MKITNRFKRSRLSTLIMTTVILGLSVDVAYAIVEVPETISSLKGVQPAEVPDLNKYVKDKNAAIKLGKALFWDMQAGSQGQSCGSCHFSAGADSRNKNQISPGLNNTEMALQKIFDETGSGGDGGPNYTLVPDDFPFHQLENKSDRNSYVTFDTDDVSSSQGVFREEFYSLNKFARPGSYDNFDKENCEYVSDFFHVNNINNRRVEPRNTPTVINAIYNFRNFWDGRANNVFNGVDPFGRRNQEAKVIHFDRWNGNTTLKEVNLKNSSAASQAVGPPLSPFEMSCDKREFKHIGRKLLGSNPLGLQEVDQTDSVLGSLAVYGGKGLRTDYRQMIMDAFQDEYWISSEKYDGYSQIEANFSLFWGLAIQLYEGTLISDDSRFDRFMDGDSTALTAKEQEGMGIFLGQGRCVNCHSGPELSKAATHLNPEDQEGGLIERMIMGDGDMQGAIYDNGFYNIGVRPTTEDLGVGGKDGSGNPLSYTRQAQDIAAGKGAPDSFEVDPDTFEVRPGDPITTDERNAVDGAFKVPGLRNVELTGPYMHNGGMSTLEQVVEFYNRGGNRRGPDEGPDSSGYGDYGSNIDPDIRSLDLTPYQQEALVAFLKALTDERVRWEKAPFDRPQLFVPVGAKGDEHFVENSGNGQAIEEWMELPKVGKYGRAAKNMPPVKNFLHQDPEPTAADDQANVKLRKATVITILGNDKATTGSLVPSSVVIVDKPMSRYGTLVKNGDGTVTYTAIKMNQVTFTYTVKDTNGLTSNKATVTIKTTF